MKQKFSGFSKIDRILNQTAKNYHLETALYKHQALKHWQTVAGAFVEDAAKLTQAIGFQKGVLVVACLSKEAASKIKFLAKQIISALNELIGRQVVYAISIET